MLQRDGPLLARGGRGRGHGVQRLRLAALERGAQPQHLPGLRGPARAQRHRHALRRRGRLVPRRPRPGAWRRVVRRPPERAVHLLRRALRPRAGGRRPGERGQPCCGPALPARGGRPAPRCGGPRRCPPAQADALGRSALWWAAAAGDAADGRAAGGPRRGAGCTRPRRRNPAACRRTPGPCVPSVQLLLARGADANRAAGHGVSPLQLAVAGGHLQTASAAAAIGRRRRTRRTASAAPRCTRWRSAATCSWRCCCCSHGADATLASRHGSDALQIARRSRQRDAGGDAARLGPGGAQARPRRRRARQRPGGGVEPRHDGARCVPRRVPRCA